MIIEKLHSIIKNYFITNYQKLSLTLGMLYIKIFLNNKKMATKRLFYLLIFFYHFYFLKYLIDAIIIGDAVFSCLVRLVVACSQRKLH